MRDDWSPDSPQVEIQIDPDRANARGPRARDIASQRVADHDRLWGARADAVERDLEDARVGFRETDLARDDNRAEVARERRARELLTLDVGCSVGHEREPMIQSEPREHRLGLRIDRLSRAPDRPVRLDELVRERVVRHANRCERPGPDLSTERRHKIAQRAQLRRLPAEISPEPLAPPDPHRVRVRRRRRGFPEPRGKTRHRGHQRIRVDPGAARREFARRAHRGKRGLVLHDERVIEIEEDRRPRHGASDGRVQRTPSPGPR